MTTKEELSREIESTPEGLLTEVLDFLRFIKYRQSSSLRSQPLSTSTPAFSTGETLLAHLKTIGTWQGDDLDTCWQSVYESRSPIKFNNDNPFDS